MNNPQTIGSATVVLPWYLESGAASLLSHIHPSDLQIIEVTPVIGHKYYTWMLLSESLEEGLHLVRSSAVDRKAGCTFRSDIVKWLKVEKDVPTVTDAIVNLWGDPQVVRTRLKENIASLSHRFNADPVRFAEFGNRDNQSSNIFGWEYDNRTSVLSVMFNSGKTYQYEEVPPHVIGSLEASESKGEFISANIVKSGYVWKLLPDDLLPERDAMIKRGFDMAEAFRMTGHGMTSDTLLHFSHKLRDSGQPVTPLKRYFNECAERLEILSQRRG